MKKTFTDFLAFLKKPSLLKLSKDKTTLRLDFLWLLLLDFFFALVVSLIHFVLVEFKLIKEYQGPDFLQKYGIYGMFIIACVFAPLLEECLFRWHLRRRYASIYFVLLSISSLIISFIITTWIGFLVFFGCLALAIITEIYVKKQSQTQKHLLWKRIFPFVFYYSAMVFGLIHLSNFNGLTVRDPAFIIFISSQAFGGLTFGYIRIKYGLRYSMLSHGCFNFIVLVLSILLPNS